MFWLQGTFLGLQLVAANAMAADVEKVVFLVCPKLQRSRAIGPDPVMLLPPVYSDFVSGMCDRGNVVAASAGCSVLVGWVVLCTFVDFCVLSMCFINSK